jgi:hypothetical protein
MFQTSLAEATGTENGFAERSGHETKVNRRDSYPLGATRNPRFHVCGADQSSLTRHTGQ